MQLIDQRTATASQLEKIPAVKLGRDAIRQYWLDNEEVSGRFYAEYKQREAEQMMEEVIRIPSSPDPP